MRFEVRNGGTGDCLCGKRGVHLNIVVFDEPVEIKTWNHKRFEGKRFQFGNECLHTFEVNGNNPLQLRQQIAEARKVERIRVLRENIDQFRR